MKNPHMATERERERERYTQVATSGLSFSNP